MEDQVLSMQNICKSFPGVKALDHVRFELKKGEVHALVGENGAGKSTLMKVLTGVYRKDSGDIIIDGKPAEFKNVKEAMDDGIIMIPQELNLMNHLTVAENIYIGREFKKHGVFLDKAVQNRKSAELFEKLNVHIDPKAKVGSLSVAQQQMVEIAKALSFNLKVLIMDEPTASLTDTEVNDLFRVIRLLKEEGKSVIHISHRLEELPLIADRITVMRDGCYVDTVDAKDTPIDSIIRMMVGRQIFVEQQTPKSNEGLPLSLEVRHLNCRNKVKDVSFKAYAGEILGFAGLVGAGRTETARAIFGADPRDSGEIYIRGNKVDIRTPTDGVEHGIAYLSEDRKQFGLALGMNVDTNVSLASMKEFSNHGFIQKNASFANTDKLVKELSIKTPSIRQLVKYLSGGNQQKVVLAKWLTKNSDIIIFDEPTRGIDIGAKSEIYDLLNQLAESGKTVIVISSEMPEIIRCCHRVEVMCEGSITGELTGTEITQEAIMKYATQRKL